MAKSERAKVTLLRLWDHRVAQGLTQEELGKRSGLQACAISHFELGTRTPSAAAAGGRQMIETPRANCATCGCRVSLAMSPPYEPDLKQGYRCTDCEQPFCAVCIKGDKHTSKWKAPCRDDELEAWATAVVEHEAFVKLAEWGSVRGNNLQMPFLNIREMWVATGWSHRDDDHNHYETGPTPGTAALSLARKLGLVPGVAGESGGGDGG